MHRDSTRRRVRRLLPVSVLALLAATFAIAPSAFAASPSVVGTLLPASVPAGSTNTVSFTLTTTSSTARSFNLTPPGGWSLSALNAPVTVNLVSGVIQGRNLNVTSSSPLQISFSSTAPCAASSGTDWTLVAKSGGGFTGSGFGVDASSVLSSPLTGTCRSSFLAGPADAAFNGQAKSENITSQPYTPGGAAMQAQALDGANNPLAGVQLTLDFGANPSTANLTGPIAATTNAQGVATFVGSLVDPVNPISISKIGLNYTLKATGAGVDATPSGTFSVYQEGKICGSGSCQVHGNSADNKISADVFAPTGDSLAVLVEDFTLECQGPGTQLQSAAIIWKYAGTDAQTVTAFVDKSLVKKVTDRGSHIDVCYQTDNGKTFVDKFGNPPSTTGFLPDCRPDLTTNCIASETGLNGGKIIVFTVEDGKGRI